MRGEAARAGMIPLIRPLRGHLLPAGEKGEAAPAIHDGSQRQCRTTTNLGIDPTAAVKPSRPALIHHAAAASADTWGMSSWVR